MKEVDRQKYTPLEQVWTDSDAAFKIFRSMVTRAHTPQLFNSCNPHPYQSHVIAVATPFSVGKITTACLWMVSQNCILLTHTYTYTWVGYKAFGIFFWGNGENMSVKIIEFRCTIQTSWPDRLKRRALPSILIMCSLSIPDGVRKYITQIDSLHKFYQDRTPPD